MSIAPPLRVTVLLPLLCLAGCSGYVARPPSVAVPAPLTALAPSAGGKTVVIRASDTRDPVRERPCDLTPEVSAELSRAFTDMGLKPVAQAPADYVATAHVYQCHGFASTGAEAAGLTMALLSGFTLGVLPAIVRHHSGLELSIHREGQLLYRHRSQTRIGMIIGLLAAPVALANRRGESPALAQARHLVQQQLVELDAQGGL